MNNELNQQLKHIQHQEQKILNHTDSALMKATVSPVIDKIQSIIPSKVNTALDAAFYKGFQLVFEKGSPYIEKTFNKEQIELDFDVNNYAIDKKMNKRHIKKLDQKSKQSKMFHSSVSVLEGGVLGLLGIGLPDIPLFLSVLVKSVYEIALSYGYSYDTSEEKSYILLLLCGAIAKDSQQKEFDTQLDKLGANIDNSIVVDLSLDAQMKATSTVLSNSLLTAKFLQGIPIVGAVGSVVNYNIVNRVTKYASIKYKKRYLLKKGTN